MPSCFLPIIVGQIFEARHQPGTIAYSNDLMWQMLEETCAELARNGLKKIILFNGHGGNTSFLQYFCQSQLARKERLYCCAFPAGLDPVKDKEIESLKESRSMTVMQVRKRHR